MIFGKKKVTKQRVDVPSSANEEEKKASEKKEIDKVNSSENFSYDIELYDVSDITSKRLKPFGANRIIEGNNVYLYNPKNGFKEPFPENSEEYKDFKLEELDKEIKATLNNISKINKGKSDRSLKDEKKQLRVLRGYKRSLELQGRGSYLIVNSNGKFMYMFDRVGNIKMPLFKNVDRSLIYTPTELKTKEVTQLLKENDTKNGEPERVRLSTYSAAILMFLAAITLFYFSYKTASIPDNFLEYMKIQAEYFKVIGQDLNSLNESISNIVSSQSPDLSVNPSTSQVTGK